MKNHNKWKAIDVFRWYNLAKSMSEVLPGSFIIPVDIR